SRDAGATAMASGAVAGSAGTGGASSGHVADTRSASAGATSRRRSRAVAGGRSTGPRKGRPPPPPADLQVRAVAGACDGRGGAASDRVVGQEVTELDPDGAHDVVAVGAARDVDLHARPAAREPGRTQRDRKDERTRHSMPPSLRTSRA